MLEQIAVQVLETRLDAKDARCCYQVTHFMANGKSVASTCFGAATASSHLLTLGM